MPIEQNLITIKTEDKAKVEKCIICGEILRSECERHYGYCVSHSEKVKRILATALSFGAGMFSNKGDEVE